MLKNIVLGLNKVGSPPPSPSTVPGGVRGGPLLPHRLHGRDVQGPPAGRLHEGQAQQQLGAQGHRRQGGAVSLVITRQVWAAKFYFCEALNFVNVLVQVKLAATSSP